MRAALPVALALLVGCGAGSPVVETSPAGESGSVAPPPRQAWPAIALAREGSSEPLLVLDPDGRIHHARCDVRWSAAPGSPTTLRDARGDLLLEAREREIVDASGRVLFRIGDDRLVRPDGRAAIVEGDRVRFEGSPSIVLRGEGLDEGRRAALLLIAALSICEG